MNILLNIVLAVQLLSAIAMVGLVLVQHGKGADMGASFGGGSAGSLFGATGSANFLSRSTAVCAAVFFSCTLALAFLSHDTGGARAGSSSILQRAAAASGAASGPAAAQIPAAPVPAAPAVPTAPAAPSAASR